MKVTVDNPNTSKIVVQSQSSLQDIIQLATVDANSQVSQALEVQKNYNPTIQNRTIVDSPKVGENYRPVGPMVFNIALQADEFIPWGYDLKGRDAQLRGFWHTEPFLASAIYAMTTHLATLDWEIVPAEPEKPRPKNTIMSVERMLRNSDRGKGWPVFFLKLMTDVYTQDNAGFMELIRPANRPDTPVIGLAHLDSYRCYRTGDPEWPVIYVDRHGVERKLRWWNVQTVEDMPSPVETMYGAHYSAVTRCLRASQIIRDITLYKKEKISGSFARAVHFISGITRQNIEDGLALANEAGINQNLTRYNQAPIIPTIDPTASLSHVQVDLAALPDGFDEDVALRWYVTQLAVAFGVDYQEFAPLSGGGLGSGNQSKTLHLKGQGKGPAMMVGNIEHIINDNGIVPGIVKFRVKNEDIQGDKERADARFARGKDRALRLDAGELDIEGSRRQAVEDGDLSAELLEEMSKRPLPTPANADPLTGDQVTGGSLSHNERKMLDKVLIYEMEENIRNMVEKAGLPEESANEILQAISEVID